MVKVQWLRCTVVKACKSEIAGSNPPLAYTKVHKLCAQRWPSTFNSIHARSLAILYKCVVRQKAVDLGLSKIFFVEMGKNIFLLTFFSELGSSRNLKIGNFKFPERGNFGTSALGNLFKGIPQITPRR